MAEKVAGRRKSNEKLRVQILAQVQGCRARQKVLCCDNTEGQFNRAVWQEKATGKPILLAAFSPSNRFVMAWKYLRGKIWWIATRAGGVLVQQSTGETDEARAESKRQALDLAERAQKANRLNRELWEVLTGTQIEAIRLHKALDTWTKETTNAYTKGNYSNVSKLLKKAFPGNPTLGDITRNQLREFLSDLKETRKASTANLALASLKAFFSRFAGAYAVNPTKGIPNFKREHDASERQPFTLDELRRLIAIAPPFWKCAIGIAFYTGLRLSNVATLKPKNLQGGGLVLKQIKTGKQIATGALPTSLVAELRKQINGTKQDDFIWPEAAAFAVKSQISGLSLQFGRLLVKAKIREKKKGKGRAVYPLSFHSIRHSFISQLAKLNVPEQITKKLAGHATTRIHEAYTHADQETLDSAVAKLPEISI